MAIILAVIVGLYLLVSLGVVIGATAYARREGRSARRWGWSAALVMYLIPFWDWIPTVAVHQYYCATEAGFRVYKTPEQWKMENPGVMETLVANKGTPSTRRGDKPDFADTYVLNQRINKVVAEARVSSALHIFRHEETVVDRKAEEVLGRYVNYAAGYPNGLALGGPPGAGLAALKFWLANPRCSDTSTHRQHQFFELENQFTGRQ